MNTIYLLTAIALLTCILTPAYVIFFVKYVLQKQFKKHGEEIDVLKLKSNSTDAKIDEMLFDEIERRGERIKQIFDINKTIQEVDSKINHKHSVLENNLEQVQVDIDFLRRTTANDLSKANERLDLQSALNTSLSNNLELMIESKFEGCIRLINNLESQLDSLQSLHITTQHILKRIDSKEFAKEVLNSYFEKVGKDKLQKEEFLKLWTDGRAKREGFAKGIVDDWKTQNKDVVHQEQPTTSTDVEKQVRKRNPKKDSKRKITMREIETAFKEKTGLTYFGYVTKYGQKAFTKKKGNIYDVVYYQKFKKKNKTDINNSPDLFVGEK